MAGKAIQLFNDWLLSTDEHQMTGPSDILNEVVSQTYLLSRMLKGKGAAQVVGGGNSITDRIQLTDTSQFSFYQPNETFSPEIEDILDKVTYYWRFAHNMWAYTEHEILLNEGDQLAQFKKLRDSKRKATRVNTFNKMEQALWSTPSTTTMETNTGTRPFSLRAFITTDGGAYSGFTTVGGVNPTTKTRWKNQYSGYASANIDTQLLPAFDDLWLKVNFESPPSMAEYIANTKFSKFMILTNAEGRKKYMALTRESNDRLTPANDPGWVADKVTYNGIPVDYIKEIDNCGFSAGQPPYFWLNTEYIYPVFHTKKYFETKPPMSHPNQPYTWVVHEDTWYNIVCFSRQRQGMVFASS